MGEDCIYARIYAVEPTVWPVARSHKASRGSARRHVHLWVPSQARMHKEASCFLLWPAYSNATQFAKITHASFQSATPPENSPSSREMSATIPTRYVSLSFKLYHGCIDNCCLQAKYWTRKRYDMTHKDDGDATVPDEEIGMQGGSRLADNQNVRMPWIIKANGQEVSGEYAKRVRASSHEFFLRIIREGRAPKTWSRGASDELKRQYYNHMYSKHPELDLGELDWKPELIAILGYPGFYRNHKHEAPGNGDQNSKLRKSKDKSKEKGKGRRKGKRKRGESMRAHACSHAQHLPILQTRRTPRRLHRTTRQGHQEVLYSRMPCRSHSTTPTTASRLLLATTSSCSAMIAPPNGLVWTKLLLVLWSQFWQQAPWTAQ